MVSTIAFYTGDGTTTDFTVPFDYLAKKFVRVSRGTTILTGGDYGDTSKDYYFLDKNKVRLKVPPATGEEVTIRRYTSATDHVVSFKDASVLKANDLDVSSVQTIHIAEEARDVINDALLKDKQGNWDAKDKRITNVGAPVADNDAMTYGIYKADALGAHQSKIAAEKARDRAIEAETNSKKSEANAKLSEVKSQASAGTAVSASKHADTVKVENQAILQEAKEIRDENKVLDANTKDNANVAQVKANEAKVSEANAKVSEANAKKSEVNSKESEGNAKVSEGKASASAELAKNWATKLVDTVDGTEYSAKYYANKANEVLTQVATDVVNRVTAEGTKQVGLVNNQGTTSVNAVKAQQTASVNAVVTQQGTSVKAVQAQQTTSVNTVTAEGTKQVGLVSTEGTKQVDLAKAQVTLATQSASTATAKATIATQQATLATTKASEAEDSATAANADATKAANSASTSTAQATAASNSAKAAKLSEDNAALSKTAAGTSETNAKASEVEAKKQADLAKQYADQAVAGQLQADWAETNTTSVTFIKNKPTLGALASKNSIAYSEITGTPPEQDLSGLATKEELQTGLASKADKTELTEGLAGKANSSHTHTVSQITDMPKVVLSVNNITPNGSGNVLVDVGAKTVEGKAPDGQGNIALGLHAVATSGSYNDLANKPSIPATPNAYVIETWRSGTNWYRVWSDGWIEQGGHGTGGTCTFNKSFSNTNYTFNVQPSNEYTSHPDWVAAYELRSDRTTTKTSIAYYDHGDQGWDWRASGY